MMSFDSETFEHRKALLQLGDLLSDDDSKKIVFVEGLPKALEEKSPWEVLAHLEVQGKTTGEELTRILKAINRHDAAEKAKELIGKPHRRKKDPEYKALMLKESLQLAEKHCKVLVEQVDYLKFAANIGGNKRIEEMASEAKENLKSQVQKNCGMLQCYSAPKLIVQIAVHPHHLLKVAHLTEVQTPALLF